MDVKNIKSIPDFKLNLRAIADLVKNNPFNEHVTMLPALFLFTRDKNKSVCLS